MAHTQLLSTEVLLLRPRREEDRYAPGVRILRMAADDRMSTVVYRREDVLAVIAEWLDELSARGHETPREGS